eukprot:TRINITY_DN78803_c0_g1_i1.p1 TRINITY_DN78803_c0_g1~~TRINITY_DN78803_c0_g1_i1.p1  ORF type:complete len:157 (-),score=14.90 TRINITY_DN78803_c0_g1_i1:359-829(-)
MELEDFRKLGDYDTITFKTVTAAASSFVLGSVAGAIVATWQNVPAVERNVALPALIKTGRVMGRYGAYFAAVGSAFAAADAISQEARGKKDLWNGVVGGLAAGAVVGLQANSLPVAAGACASLAVASAVIDASGHATRVPTGREYLPYSTSPTNSS